MLCLWDFKEIFDSFCKKEESKRKSAEKESSKQGNFFIRFVESSRIKKRLDRILWRAVFGKKG